jgi:hypothetical protein
MRYLIILLTFILILSCKKNDNSELLIGTWTKCNESGQYFEWKIDKNNILILGLLKDDIAIFENTILDNSLIMKGVNCELPNEVDTLVFVDKSKNKIILKTSWNNQIIELTRIENSIEKIDSTDIENWTKQTIFKFKERGEHFNCPDLRTEKEKMIPSLEIDIDSIMNVEEETIVQLNDSLNQ